MNAMAAPSRRGFELVYDSAFGQGDPLAGWIPYYLPHWSSREQTAARWSVADGRLILRIDVDQPRWCPEFDGSTRVSGLQTGLRSGPVGSKDGQSHFSPDLVVREQQPETWLCAPLYGYVEIRLKAVAEPQAMIALWMIGTETVREESAEICVCEIFGEHVTRTSLQNGSGLHPFGDPNITDEFTVRTHDLDTAEFHTYSIDWTPDHVDFFVDGERAGRSEQSPDYPMQLMLGLFEFPEGPEKTAPIEGAIEFVRVYAPV